jgi:GntR family transcriptional regulator, transcriptional repressor for pyruvate dehydrogenase complex
MEEAMIRAQATTGISCTRMTALHLSALHDSVERASCLAAGPQWDRKATAHAEIFDLLADVADDPTLAPLLKGGAAHVRELMLAVGRAADGMIVSSRQRLLAHMRAGDWEGATLEIERHLKCLHFMWRLARRRQDAGGRNGPATSLLTGDAAAFT